MNGDKTSIVNFLFETGILSKTPRSGFYFLGSGQQSVAEHSNRSVYVGFVLATLEGDVDVSKVMKMCLFHDLAEGRTSDLNYVHQKYVKADEHKAIKDLTSNLPFGGEIKEILKEYEERETKESIVAKDADNIEWILCLKEQIDNGNAKASTWILSAVKRLKTKIAMEIAEVITTTNSDSWWGANNPKDNWWVTRNKKS